MDFIAYYDSFRGFPCSSWDHGENDANWSQCNDNTSSWRNRSPAIEPDNVNLYRHINFVDRIACVHRGESEKATSDNNDQVSSHLWVRDC